MYIIVFFKNSPKRALVKMSKTHKNVMVSRLFAFFKKGDHYAAKAKKATFFVHF